MIVVEDLSRPGVVPQDPGQPPLVEGDEDACTEIGDEVRLSLLAAITVLLLYLER